MRFICELGALEHEEVVEAALLCILSRPTWHKVTQEIAESFLCGSSLDWDSHHHQASEELMLARVAIEAVLEFNVPCGRDSLSVLPLVRQSFRALRAGQSFQLRQLLQIILLHKGVDDVEEQRRSLLRLSTAVLMRAPLEDLAASPPHPIESMTHRRYRTCFDLGILLGRKALGIRPRLDLCTARQLECQFSEMLLLVQRCLQDGSSSGLPDLGDPTDGELVTTSTSTSTSTSAVEDPTLSQVAKGDVSLSQVDGVLVESAPERLQRILQVAEAGLAHSRSDLVEDFPMTLLLSEVLQPSLKKLTDANWGSLRAIAVRCIGLHASLSKDGVIEHWPFFLELLKKYGAPAVMQTSASARTPEAAEAAALAETGLFFLTDSLLMHLRCHSAENIDERSGWICELFQALAPVLGLPSSGPAPHFRRICADRFCTLLLFGSAWVPSVDGAGSLDITAEARWAVTWLLVEAFYRRRPSSKKHGCDDADAAEAAAVRARLLQFFNALARLSAQHMMLLAVAAEAFLLSDLWRLGAMVPLGCRNRRWCAVPLPRLVRFLCRQLMTSPGQAGDVAGLWLCCVWWPLVLALQQTGSEHTCGIPLLQALVASVEAMTAAGQDTGGPMLAFLPEQVRPNIAAEIAWSLNEILELWSTTGDLSSGASLKQLRKLQAEARNAASDVPADTIEADVRAARHAVMSRRDVIQESLAGFGIDTARIAVITTETLRVRQSNVFLIEQKREAKFPPPLSPAARRRGVVKAGLKTPKKRREVPDDDDSENEVEGTPAASAARVRSPEQGQSGRRSRVFLVPHRPQHSPELQQMIPLQDISNQDDNCQAEGDCVNVQLDFETDVAESGGVLQNACDDGEDEETEAEEEMWESEAEIGIDPSTAGGEGVPEKWEEAPRAPAQVFPAPHQTRRQVSPIRAARCTAPGPGQTRRQPTQSEEEATDAGPPEKQQDEEAIDSGEAGSSAFPFPLKRPSDCDVPRVTVKQEEDDMPQACMSARAVKRQKLSFHDFVDGLGRQASRIHEAASGRLKRLSLLSPWGKETNQGIKTEQED